VPDMVGKLHAIHGAGHLNVGEHHANVRPCFQDGDGFIGVRSSNGFETSVRDEVQGIQEDNRVVFDYQDNCGAHGRFDGFGAYKVPIRAG